MHILALGSFIAIYLGEKGIYSSGSEKKLYTNLQKKMTKQMWQNITLMHLGEEYIEVPCTSLFQNKKLIHGGGFVFN